MSGFHTHFVNGRQYWRWQCKECVKPAARARKQRWYACDPERARADSRTWYAENRERAIATIQHYKLAHADWWRNYQKHYMRKRRAAGG